MAIHDTIGDFLTTLRNGSMATKPVVKARHSKMRESIANILKSEGYLLDYRVTQRDNGLKDIEVSLKFRNDQPAIEGIKRESKPGCRRYFKYEDIPPVLGGLGISILTTSKGLMTGDEAKRQKLGGELLCQVW
jgi:small subunit ribosomal protein S8